MSHVGSKRRCHVVRAHRPCEHHPPHPRSLAAVLRLSHVMGSDRHFRQSHRASTGGELQIGNEVRGTEDQNRDAHGWEKSGLGTRTVRI